MKYIEIKHRDYLLRGFLTEGKKRAKTLVVFFHGFTGHKNETGFLYKSLAKSLAEHNIASLRMDFYGSGDSDGEFKEMTFQTEVEDGRAIIEYAKSLNYDNLVLTGFSMGGAVASFIACEYKDSLDKLVLISPAGNMNLIASRYLDHHVLYNDEAIDMGGYLLGIGFINGLKDLDLYQHIDEFTKPVLIIHGEKDISVPIEFGKKYASIYHNARFKMIEDAGHGYQTMKQRAILENEFIQFIKAMDGE